jgi:hypothetical protein
MVNYPKTRRGLRKSVFRTKCVLYFSLWLSFKAFCISTKHLASYTRHERRKFGGFSCKVSAIGSICDQILHASTTFIEDFRVSLRLLFNSWYFSVFLHNVVCLLRRFGTIYCLCLHFGWIRSGGQCNDWTETHSESRSAISWDFVQLTLVVCYRRFGPIFKVQTDCLTLEDWSDLKYV